MKADFAIFGRDTPEATLLVELKLKALSESERDQAIRHLSRAMWNVNCSYGLIITPAYTYVLRESPLVQGPESIRLSHTIPTEKLIRTDSLTPAKPLSGETLRTLAQDWLEHLTRDYEQALQNDPQLAEALFPEIIGAVAHGRVVAEAAV